MPAEGLEPWLKRTGYFRRTLAEMEREIDREEQQERLEQAVRIFWSHVEKRGEHWLWTGPLGKCGVPRMRLCWHELTATRFAWVYIAKRSCPSGMMPRPECGEAMCVRPEHLAIKGKRGKSGKDCDSVRG